ncbi:hypothetical protein EAH77_22260 [Ewingella americana]|uniref:Uncharacterized protein n=1 Tax=Ewingella americana TaxID=41202 RepID=A0A502G5X7_9GAMM|nr:hypothetical protein EAH77_22260 [Ewingella americana]
MCAVGVVPTRPVAAVGAYLRVRALAKLRACTQNFQQSYFQRYQFSSYNIHYKATLFRAFGPGRGGFSGGRRGCVLARCWGLMWSRFSECCN